MCRATPDVSDPLIDWRNRLWAPSRSEATGFSWRIDKGVGVYAWPVVLNKVWSLFLACLRLLNFDYYRFFNSSGFLLISLILELSLTYCSGTDSYRLILMARLRSSPWSLISSFLKNCFVDVVLSKGGRRPCISLISFSILTWDDTPSPCVFISLSTFCFTTPVRFSMILPSLSCFCSEL